MAVKIDLEVQLCFVVFSFSISTILALTVQCQTLKCISVAEVLAPVGATSYSHHLSTADLFKGLNTLIKSPY